MRKTLIVLLLALAIIPALAVRSYAAELPDETRPGSLVITMSFEGDPLDDGVLTVTRVGEICVVNGNAGFELVEALSDGPALKDLNDPELADRLADLAADRDLPGIRAEIKDGRAVFSDLQPGLYVVTQRSRDAAGGFAPIQPFLLSLPQLIDGNYVYDLTAAPKVPLEPKPTEPTEPTQPTEPTEPTEPPPGLPETGQLNWPVPVLAILGLGLFTAGWILCFKSRREADEA